MSSAEIFPSDRTKMSSTYYILDGVLHKKSSIKEGKILSRGDIPEDVLNLIVRPRNITINRVHHRIPYLLENELVSVNHWIRTGVFELEPYYPKGIIRKLGKCPIYKTQEEAEEKRFK